MVVAPGRLPRCFRFPPPPDDTPAINLVARLLFEIRTREDRSKCFKVAKMLFKSARRDGVVTEDPSEIC